MRATLGYFRRTIRPPFAVFLTMFVFTVGWSATPAFPGDPPTPPTNPRPADGSISQSILSTLRWECIDFDNDMAAYDVYLGLDAAPPLAAADLTYKYYQPASLEPLSTYYWRVVARDAEGHETSSPTWSFTTGPENVPPEVPSAPAPSHGSAGNSVEVTLTWTCSDLDGDSLTYSVYFGTDADPPVVVAGLVQTSHALESLAYGTTYYWRIAALDARGAETSGPVWSFSTRYQNQPPITPFSPSPFSGYSGASFVWVDISWRSSDPEDDAVVYDVYFGTDPSPPLAASDVPHGVSGGDRTYYDLPDLAATTTYYWKIVAKDALDAESSSPVWTFTTKANSPPYAPHQPDPPDGSTGRFVTSSLHSFNGDPDGQACTYDVYFGTENPPPLAKSNHDSPYYTPYPPLQFFTQYWWRVVARDPFGLESGGPVWTFTTGGNHAPVVTWSSPTPPDGGQGYPVTTLRWWGYDTDGQATVDDVYFGTSEPLPLIATDVAGGIKTYALEDTLEVGLTYYWRIVTSDGELEGTGKTWSFTVVESNGLVGDVDNDGHEDMDDVDCAMDIYFDPFCRFGDDCCGGHEAWLRADTDCDEKVTPRDARCIHRHMLDGSCTYCEGAAAVTPSRALVPVVSRDAAWVEYDTLFVRLAVSNVPALEAFGFVIDADNTTLMRVKNLGGADGFHTRQYGPNTLGVGGYFLNAVDASSPVTVIELVYFTKGFNFVRVRDFVDDVALSPELIIPANEVPVLISSFRAVPVRDGVRLSWELVSDEAMEKFTLYRRDGKDAMARVIAEGPVESTSGSFIDHAAQPGKTYYYELAIETADGDVFRSQAATATLAALRLALHQNRPNPFNPETVIRYEVPGDGGAVRVRLWVLDVAGHVVRTLVDEDQSAGSREVIWRGTNHRGEPVSSGVYFYVLDAGGERRTRKLVLLK